MKKLFFSLSLLMAFMLVVPNTSNAVPGFIYKIDSCSRSFPNCYIDKVRCKYGNGGCNPSDQNFCEEQDTTFKTYI